MSCAICVSLQRNCCMKQPIGFLQISAHLFILSSVSSDHSHYELLKVKVKHNLSALLFHSSCVKSHADYKNVFNNFLIGHSVEELLSI